MLTLDCNKADADKVAVCVLEHLIHDLLVPVNVEARYREWLDDAYSFAQVGGPFESMLPSSVLEDTDPVAFREGLSDWLTGDETVSCIGDKWYDREEVENLRNEMVAALDEYPC